MCHCLTYQIITSANINSFGLLLDMIGVIGLIKYGMPPINLFKHVKAIESFPHDLARRYSKYSICSLVLITVGFLFQIWSNYL